MKFLQFALVFASASLALAQVQYTAVGTDAEIDPHPKYEFQYSVADPVTGDQKSQQEARDGDKVTGFYTLVESDGSLRRVEYYADAVSGFTATVTHQPGGQAPPAPATYQTYRPTEVVAPVKVVAAPAPVTVVPAPVKVQPAVNYQSGYYGYQPAYYQNSGYYQQPATYYQQPAAYYQQPATTYYQQPAPAVTYNKGQQATVTGYFSSPYANYALPGAGNPVGAVNGPVVVSKQ
uniref:Cuticle protein 8 n=1 Tax=Cacopsylla melanoneura TaxID=428564 RepID=A0A8D9FB22_9HEMI